MGAGVDAKNEYGWTPLHYRASTEAGSALGRKVGEYVLGNVLLPLNGRPHHAGITGEATYPMSRLSR
jgi:hypothetical protein